MSEEEITALRARVKELEQRVNALLTYRDALLDERDELRAVNYAAREMDVPYIHHLINSMGNEHTTIGGSFRKLTEAVRKLDEDRLS